MNNGGDFADKLLNDMIKERGDHRDKKIELGKKSYTTKETSLKTYINKLVMLKKYKMGTSEPVQLVQKDINLLKDIDLVEKFLKEKNLKETSKNSYYIAYSIILRTTNNPKLQKYYSLKVRDLTEKYKAQEETQEKNQKQKANWDTLENLQRHVDTLGKEVDKLDVFNKEVLLRKDYKIIQKWLVGSLYVADPTNMPPFRADYAPMSIIDIKDFKEDDNNYLVIDEDITPIMFYVGEHKTLNSHGAKKINITGIIKERLELFLQARSILGEDSSSFLLNRMFKPMDANGLSKYIPIVFKRDGIDKKITINLLRHIVISEQVPARNKKEQELAKTMGHSVSTQRRYSKKLED